MALWNWILRVLGLKSEPKSEPKDPSSDGSGTSSKERAEYFCSSWKADEYDARTVMVVQELLTTMTHVPYIHGYGHPISFQLLQKILKTWVDMELKMITHSEKLQLEAEQQVDREWEEMENESDDSSIADRGGDGDSD